MAMTPQTELEARDTPSNSGGEEVRRVNDAVIAEAAWAWRNSKSRETGADDTAYFKGNWRHLPGLRNFVEHALLSRLEAAEREKERLQPYADELSKLAADLGEPDDPFAVWESLEAIKSERDTAIRDRDEARALLVEAEEVLQPFAAMGSLLPAHVPDERSYCVPPLKAANFRRAAALSSKIAEQGGEGNG